MSYYVTMRSWRLQETAARRNTRCLGKCVNERSVSNGICGTDKAVVTAGGDESRNIGSRLFSAHRLHIGFRWQFYWTVFGLEGKSSSNSHITSFKVAFPVK